MTRRIRIRPGQYGRFEQIKNPKEIGKLIELRIRAFESAGIRGGGEDEWDLKDSTRYFAVVDGEGNIEKAIRVIKRTAESSLPCELNLFKDILNPSERIKLGGLLGKYSGDEKTVVEISGIVGDHKTRGSVHTLVGGVMNLEGKESWDLLLQVQHPRHAKAYGHFLPYGVIASNFVDYSGRPATLLALAKEEYLSSLKDLKKD